MPERFENRMNQSDTTLWRIERDPRLRTTIVGVALLAGVPEWGALRERIEAVSWVVPRLRQRVMAPPFGIGPPRWVPDEAFDLEYHLRRVVAPEPGDLQTLLGLAEPIAMAAFDRDRPLWEFTLVEGLTGGRSALIQKVHHCVTDGVGAIRIARLVFDEHDTDDLRHADGLSDGAGRGSPLRVVLDNVADQSRVAARVAGRAMAALPGTALNLLLSPEHVAQDGVRTTRSIVKLVTPAREPLSPIMRERGLGRRLAAFEVPLDELKAAGRAAGGTMNDAFLAALTGGMRRYHERHGAAVTQLRVTMPINLRRDDDAVGNNRFVPARFALPVDEPDPIVRMQRLGELARSWRHEPGLKYTDTVAGILNGLPEQMTAAALGSMLKAIDFVATNVPGLDTPTHLVGVGVELEIAFAPPSGASFSAALLSHVGMCSLGLVVDTAAIPDPAVFAACIREGFEEVLDVSRQATGRARRPKQPKHQKQRQPQKPRSRQKDTGGGPATHPTNGSADPADAFVPTITRVPQWTA